MTTTTAHRPTIITRGFSVLGATAAALAVWIAAVPLAGTDLTVDQNGTVQEVGAAAVIISSLLIGLAAWALLAALERFTRTPRRTWTIIAVTALALSLIGPLAQTTTTATALVLTVMHLTVAAVLIPSMRR